MAESTSGKALYAVHQGTYIIKLVGEVRVPICTTLDHFIEGMFSDHELRSVIIDLTETSIIDSTALGLLAKIAVHMRRVHGLKPVIVSTRPDINRLLDTMGFEKVFNICFEEPVKSPRMSEMAAVPCDEGTACDKVLEAHALLMELNSRNREVFKDVVAAIEQSKKRTPADDSKGPNPLTPDRLQ